MRRFFFLASLYLFHFLLFGGKTRVSIRFRFSYSRARSVRRFLHFYRKQRYIYIQYSYVTPAARFILFASYSYGSLDFALVLYTYLTDRVSTKNKISLVHFGRFRQINSSVSTLSISCNAGYFDFKTDFVICKRAKRPQNSEKRVVCTAAPIEFQRSSSTDAARDTCRATLHHGHRNQRVPRYIELENVPRT